MFDCVIVGAGPAGLTAGIYLKRKNLDVVILEKGIPGGQLTQTAVIENYPGIETINGADLATNMYMQVINLGVRVKKEEVIKIEKCEDSFKLITNKKEYEAKNVLLALGMKPNKLGFINEEKYSYKGISWCAICDGPLYKEKDVCVVGGGNSALEESLYLSSICKNVNIIHRRDEFRADDALVEKIKNTSNINLYLNDSIKEVDGNDNLEKVILESGKEINASCVFEFVGSKPSTDFLKDLNITNDNNFIVVNENFETKVKGIFAIGDCIDKKVRQITTAVGDAANAAIQIASRK